MMDQRRYRYTIGASAPTVENVDLILANTEYVLQLPANTRAISFQCRAANVVRYAFVPTFVAAPLNPYMTLKAGFVYWKDNIICGPAIGALTLYFASPVANQVVEIEIWV